MIGFLQPWWLLALGLIPLVRWLHRRQAPLSTHAVSAVFLWREDATSAEAGQSRQPPDPAWRRRALMVALLALALAGPYLERGYQHVVVWIDESDSMRTLEDGATRAEAAEALLAGALAETDFDEVERRRVPDELPAELPDDSAQWLVTDGAGSELRAWAIASRFDRVFQVGTETENVAVSRLAARRGLEAPERADILVTVSNTGDSPARRDLVLAANGTAIETIALELPAGDSVIHQTSVAIGIGRLSAAITPRDALPVDDRLDLSFNQMGPLATLVESDCAKTIRAAVAAHPGLAISAGITKPDLIVSCGNDLLVDPPNGSPEIARIRVHQDASSPVAGPPVWIPHPRLLTSPSLGSATLSATRWPVALDIAAQQAVLQAGGLPLVVVAVSDPAAPTTVDTVIDLGATAFADEPAYAALFAELVDIAYGPPLLDAGQLAARPIEDSVVRPQAIEVRSGDRPARVRMAKLPLTRWLLVATGLVLLFDILQLVLASRRARHA